MILKVDKEGKSAIEQFCDLALKSGGIRNLNQVNLVLQSTEMLPEPKEKEKTK